MQEKHVRESYVTSRKLVMPEAINPQGVLFGGTLMSWIDKTAAMVAQLHCNRHVVTISVDSLHFRTPIREGNHVILHGSVNWVGRSSMEIGVRVEKVNPYRNEPVHATSAYLTFVALDDDGHSVAVPRLILETDEERKRWRQAELRAAHRKALAEECREVDEHPQAVQTS